MLEFNSISLNTFMVGLFAVSFAYYNGIITLFEVLFYMSIISMQLLEYFAWKNLDNKKINTIISYISLILIIIQLPIALIAYEINYKYIIIFIFLLVAIYDCINNNLKFSFAKASNGHLLWNWNKFSLLFWFLYLVIGSFALLKNKQYIVFVILLITTILTYYSYSKYGTYGSMWCWTVNILSFYLIIKVFYKDFCTLEGTII